MNGLRVRRVGRFWTVCVYEGLGGFGQSACTKGWAVLDGLRVRRVGRFWTVCVYEGLGGFGQSACTKGWAVLDSLRSKELIKIICCNRGK